MFTLTPPLLLTALLLSTGGAAAWAEKADRTRPMTLESDQPCTVSLLKQTSVCSGNVVISQGTLQIRADRLELRETPESAFIMDDLLIHLALVPGGLSLLGYLLGNPVYLSIHADPRVGISPLEMGFLGLYAVAAVVANPRLPFSPSIRN